MPGWQCSKMAKMEREYGNGERKRKRAKKLRLQNGDGNGNGGGKGKGKKTTEPRTTKWQNMNKNFVRPAAADKLKLMTILL